MARSDKDIVNGLNAQVNGVGHLGVTSKVTQIKLDFEIVDDISTGKLKAQYVEIEFTKYSSMVMAELVKNNIDPKLRLPIVLKGNIRRNASDVPIVLLIQGEIHELDDGTLEENKEVTRKIKIKVDRFTRTIDNIPEVVYDRLNDVLVIDGIDVLSEYRQNVN